MPFTFVDLSSNFIEACQKLFGNSEKYFADSVELYKPTGRRVYYLSPANSLGFMDGGIDATYSIRMFPGIESKVKEAIKNQGETTLFGRHYLPIGKALVVPIDQLPNGFMVSAPTMLLPQRIRGTRNAYYAMVATISAIKEHGYDHSQDELVVPGLCCGYGAFTGEEAAQQIYEALLSDRLPSTNEILEEQPNYYENSEFKKIDLKDIVFS